MPWLCVELVHGEVKLAISYGDEKYDEKLRKVRRIEISDADAALPFDVPDRLYKDQITPPAAPPRRTAKQIKALNAIIGIIETSHHEGEREAARTAYKTVTGKVYVAGAVA